MFPLHVDYFIGKELEVGATLGPFSPNPLQSECYLSPPNTAPKKAPLGIPYQKGHMDLSWPIGTAVNDGIDKNCYLGEEVNLTYPSIDDFSQIVLVLGPGCLMFKRNFSRAYRQIPICPGDIGFLGFPWRHTVRCTRALCLCSCTFIFFYLYFSFAHLLILARFQGEKKIIISHNFI